MAKGKKQRLKKTCSGCRAFQHWEARVPCSAGFMTKTVHVDGSNKTYTAPAEVCPKPRTIEQLIIAEKRRLESPSEQLGVD